LTEELQKRFKLILSTETVPKTLRQNGFNDRLARKKPYINKKKSHKEIAVC
jgi:hypothetical protein